MTIHNYYGKKHNNKSVSKTKLFLTLHCTWLKFIYYFLNDLALLKIQLCLNLPFHFHTLP